MDTIVNYVISDVLEVISPDPPKDSRFKFSDEQILRVMVLKEIKGFSLLPKNRKLMIVTL